MDLGKSILEKSDEGILALAHQLRVAYGMKRTLRYNTTRDFTVHNESVAEHVFALIFLATYFLPLEQAGASLDKAKLYEILLYHDFGEIVHGDVPYFLKTNAHREQEAEDAKKVFESLPATLGATAEERWREYEEQSSPEAQFAYAVDKVEPMFELLDPVNERSIRRLNQTLSMHIGRKLAATEHYPVMRRFFQVLTDDMVKRNLFVDEN